MILKTVTKVTYSQEVSVFVTLLMTDTSYYNQKMTTVCTEGTDDLANMVKWILNNYTVYNKALLEAFLKQINHNIASFLQETMHKSR